MSNPAPPTEMVAHLGRLVRAERLRLGYKSAQKASDAAGIKNYRTLGQFELGHSMLSPVNRSKVEELLMWRGGSLTEALDKPFDELTFEWFRDWEREEPVSEAAQLTDEALLTELIKRLDPIRLKLVRLAELEDAQGDTVQVGIKAPTQTPAELNHQNSYDLAAHTPRSGKKVDPRKATRK